MVLLIVVSCFNVVAFDDTVTGCFDVFLLLVLQRLDEQQLISLSDVDSGTHLLAHDFTSIRIFSTLIISDLNKHKINIKF